MAMERKDVSIEVKELNDKGAGVLRFIRFHQEDKDADITLPGFIGRQEAVLLSAHNWRSDYPPLGKGESFEADGAAHFRFQLNLDDPRAQQWYGWLKMDRASGKPLQQISYGFQPYADGQERTQKDGRQIRYLKPRKDGSPGAKLHELSFVTVGSGNDQGVVDLKHADEWLSSEEKADGTVIQSLLFPKRAWDSSEAAARWARSHGFSAGKLDETDEYYHYRQRDPGEVDTRATICLTPSRDTPASRCRVLARIGPPKKEARLMDDEMPEVEPEEASDTKRAMGVHHTDTTDVAWDGNLMEGRAKTAAEKRKLYAWMASGGDPEQRQSFKFPHHMCAADGTVGAANLAACRNGLARLSNADIPEGEKAGVRAHLAAHLRDGGGEPSSEQRSVEADEYTQYAEDRRPPLPALIKWLRLYRYHMPFLRDIRKRDGKEVSQETIAEFKTLVEEMLEVVQQFNIKLRTAALLPNVEEEIAAQEHYTARHRELSQAVNAQTEAAFQALQAQGQALEQRAKAREAQIRQWGKDAAQAS